MSNGMLMPREIHSLSNFRLLVKLKGKPLERPLLFVYFLHEYYLWCGLGSAQDSSVFYSHGSMVLDI